MTDNVRRLPRRNASARDDEPVSVWDQLDDTGRGMLLVALLMACVIGGLLAVRLRVTRDRRHHAEEFRIRRVARDEAQQMLTAFMLHQGAAAVAR